MASKAGKLLGTVAPIAAGFIPGIGPLASAAIGAGNGLLTGGGLKGALLGGLTGGAGNLLGSSGGFQGLMNGGAGADAAFGKFLSGSGTAGAANAAASKGLSGGLSSILSGGGGSSFGGSGSSGFGLGGVGDALGAYNTFSAQDDIEKKMLKGQNKAAGLLQPYNQTGQAANSKLSALLGLDPSADQGAITNSIRSTPGYQFRLDQGQQALERSQAAKGGLFSGRAMKEAQDYGQGLADQTYQQAVANLGQQSQQGLGAAGNLGGLYTDMGSTGANASASRSNAINQGLSGLFGSNSNSQLLQALLGQGALKKNHTGQYTYA